MRTFLTYPLLVKILAGFLSLWFIPAVIYFVRLMISLLTRNTSHND